MKAVKYFTLNFGLQIVAVALAGSLAVVGCNDLRQPANKESHELKPSSFAAPIVDTIAVVPDSNAYILKNQ